MTIYVDYRTFSESKSQAWGPAYENARRKNGLKLTAMMFFRVPRLSNMIVTEDVRIRNFLVQRVTVATWHHKPGQAAEEFCRDSLLCFA